MFSDQFWASNVAGNKSDRRQKSVSWTFLLKQRYCSVGHWKCVGATACFPLSVVFQQTESGVIELQAADPPVNPNLSLYVIGDGGLSVLSHYIHMHMQTMIKDSNWIWFTFRGGLTKINSDSWCKWSLSQVCEMTGIVWIRRTVWKQKQPKADKGSKVRVLMRTSILMFQEMSHKKNNSLSDLSVDVCLSSVKYTTGQFYVSNL